MNYILDSVADLLRLRRGDAVGFDSVELGEALRTRIPEDEVGDWEQRLTEDLLDCGCSMGAKVTAVTVILYTAAALGLYWYGAKPEWLGWVVGCAVAVLAGGVGKLVGLRLAANRLNQTVMDLTGSLAPHRPSSGRCSGPLISPGAFMRLSAGSQPADAGAPPGTRPST